MKTTNGNNKKIMTIFDNGDIIINEHVAIDTKEDKDMQLDEIKNIEVRIQG